MPAARAHGVVEPNPAVVGVDVDAVSIVARGNRWRVLLPGGTVAELPGHWVNDGLLTVGAMLRLRSEGLLTPATPAAALAVTVVPTTACNLACGYCFQNTEPAEAQCRPRRIPVTTLDGEDVDAVERFVRRRMSDTGRDQVAITVFGGEPLLRPGITVQLLEQFDAGECTSKSLVTNATLLDDVAVNALSSAGLRHVQVTLDGPRDVHDRVRTAPGMRATYDRIIDNVAAAQARVAWTWTVRVNVTSPNAHRLGDIVDDIAARLDRSCTVFDVAIVEDFGVGFEAVADADSAADVDMALRRAEQAGVRVAAPSSASCPFCGDAATGVIVGSDGALYSCWDDVGFARRSIGDVHTGYVPGAVRRRCGDTSAAVAPALLAAVDAAKLRYSTPVARFAVAVG